LNFSVKILGSCSAVPAFGRHHSAQLVKYYGSTFLIDCGEGTQLQFQLHKSKLSKLTRIFISHLHGDHFLGLFGLLSTLSLMGRTKQLQVYGPKGLREIITTQLKYSQSIIKYPLDIIELEFPKSGILFEENNLRVSHCPLDHRIDCHGFTFEEVKQSHRLKPTCENLNLSKSQIANLKKGNDILNENGEILHKNEDLTNPPRKCKKYSYCSDTKYDERIVPFIKDSDLLYHEATFLNDLASRADSTYHSTAQQAGKMASLTNTSKLLLGHFSSRYKELRPFIQEAQTEFENCELAIEGLEFFIEK